MDTKRVKTVKRNSLQWQVEGIKGNFAEAEKYIKSQNNMKVNGFHNWRQPTLLEVSKLIQNEKGLTKTQKQFGNIYIWTSSKFSASRAWVVYFSYGYCGHYDVDTFSYVRAVRSIKSKDK